MTTITLPRAVVKQALEALESVYGDSCDALHALRAALAQQAEPVEHYASIPGTNVRVRLRPEPVCPDCRGIGYDASGQLCGCQDKPSPCAYPNCVGGQAGTICKPSCPGGTK